MTVAHDLAVASQELGQNHAGIAACPAKRSGGNGLADLLHVIRILCLKNLSCCRDHGHAHVGSGIAVRHREHVQLINPGFVRLQILCSAKEHLPEELYIYGSSTHVLRSSHQSMTFTPSTKTFIFSISSPVNSSTLYRTLSMRLSATVGMFTP